MIIILKESQYNNILDSTQNDTKLLNKWASYIADIVLPKIINLDVLSGEDVFTEKNIEVKLGKYDFFKLLPINSMIFNIIVKDENNEEGSINITFSPYWTYINGENIIDLEFDIELYSPKKIDSGVLYSKIKGYLLKEIEKAYKWYIKNKENG